MRIFLKILGTFIFFMLWGSWGVGCQKGASNAFVGQIFSVMNLVLLIAGTYGIWKYNPNKSSASDDTKLRKD
jgi:hypothetical protein